MAINYNFEWDPKKARENQGKASKQEIQTYSE